MTLKALREYFVNGKLIQNLSSFGMALPYYGMGDHIDNWLNYWYGSEMANDTNFLAYLNSWHAASIERFTKIWNALREVYDPLENYNSVETEVNGKSRGELENKTAREGTVKTTTTPASVTTTDKRTTDDGLTLRTFGENETTYGAGGTVSETEETGTNHGLTQTTKYNDQKTAAAGGLSVTANEVESRELTRSGNIGVTTSQQMLTSEIELRIAHDFVKEFCAIFEAECLTGVFDYGYDY